MSYQLQILPLADQDIQHIFQYLSEYSQEGAFRWWKAFEHAVTRLSFQVESYGIAPEDEFTSYHIQQFLFKTQHGRTYRGIFTVIEQEIRILRVRGPGQPSLGEDELTL